MRYRIQVLLGLLLLAALSANAQTTRYVSVDGSDAGDNNCLNVANPCRSVSWAVFKAVSGDTISVAAGDYQSSFSTSKSLNVVGAGRDLTRLQASANPGTASNRVITVTDPTGAPTFLISDLTIRHGNRVGTFFPDTAGGGVFSDSGWLTVRRVTFTLNHASQAGGGLYCADIACQLEDVVFVDNTASNGAGMAFAANSGTLTDVVFEQNTAGVGGGGMSVGSNRTPTLNRVTFVNNSAGFNGGGIRCWPGAAPVLNDTDFMDNSADRGGGLYGDGCSPTITGGEFDNNTAISEGGGMYNLGESVPKLTGTRFSGNSAEQGGAIFNTGLTSGDFFAIKVDGNSAEEGAGIYNDNSNNVVFRGIEVTDNSATTHGGGVFNANSQVSFRDSQFKENSAQTTGAGMFNDGGTIMIRRTEISDNYAGSRGGAIKNLGAAVTELNQVAMRGNSGGSGGALTNKGATVDLHSVLFSGNEARVGIGAGLYGYDGGTVLMTNVTIAGNRSAGLGAGLYFIGDAMSVRNSLIWHNQDENGLGTASSSMIRTAAVTTVEYSLVQGYTIAMLGEGEGNLDGADADNNPLFAQAINPDQAPTESGNYRLRAISPAREVGNNDFVPTGARDLDDRPRIFGNSVDLGAYELQPSVFQDRFESQVGVPP